MSRPTPWTTQKPPPAGTGGPVGKERDGSQHLPLPTSDTLPPSGDRMDVDMEEKARPGIGAEGRSKPTISTLNTTLAFPPRPVTEEDASAIPSASQDVDMRVDLHVLGKPTLRFPDIDVETTDPMDVEVEIPAEDGQAWPAALERDHLLPPMPPRPRLGTPSHHHRGKSTISQWSVEKGTAIKPYVLEPPPAAPRLSGDGYADFFPRTGNQPEDVLSEQTIRQGYFDKAPTTQTELQSARSTLWPILKHKSGLQVLSSAIKSALEHRQAVGRITTPSTFKPPPRVTLTDTKREAWLRDLANPSIPLRRLSRTIPHGVRGRVLLDHCWSKNIPTTRAIWLTRCVGANEMRAFRRKGANAMYAMGGEAKWVRDWTIFVEQFVEAAVETCGAENWQAKMSYVLRLTAHLFSERLLDQGHYLDWLLTAFQSASVDKLPVWLLLLQLYWNEMIPYRRSGKRLVLALLEKLQLATEAETKEILQPVVHRLSQLITSVLLAKPSNFVSKSLWAQYGDLLRANIENLDPTVASALHDIGRRNGRLSPSAIGPTKLETATHKLVQLLDGKHHESELDELPARCSSLMEDPEVLLRCVLDWSTSIFRQGPSRIYLAARLLRWWREQGIDTDEAILGFLSRCKVKSNFRPHDLFLLVSDLARSGHFAVGRYLQWLIARGAVDSVGDLQEASCEVRLLAEIPRSGLSTSIINIRRMLLKRVGLTSEMEQRMLEDARSRVAAMIPGGSPSDSETKSSPSADLSSTQCWLLGLSGTIKWELSQWVLQQAAALINANGGDETTSKDQTDAQRIYPALLSQYHTIRGVLEALQDFPTLAELIKLYLTCENTTVLASIADTLHQHQDTFISLGILQSSFDGLLNQYKNLKTGKRLEKTLIYSLADLASNLPKTEVITRQLCADLYEYEHRAAVAAFSPVSDDTPNTNNLADAEFYEDVERVLSSGSTIDLATLARLFKKIIVRIESTWEENGEKEVNFGNLLVKLRTLHVKGFDELMKGWVVESLGTSSSLKLFHQLRPLVVNGSLPLRTVVACSTTILDAEHTGKDKEQASLAIALLDFLSVNDASGDLSLDQECYRFRLLQARYTAQHPFEWVAVLRRAVERSVRMSDADLSATLDRLLDNEFVVSILRRIVLNHPRRVFMELVLPLKDTASQFLEKIISALDPAGHMLYHPSQLDVDGRDITTASRIAQVTQSVGHLSLPFCQLQLLLLLSRAEQEDSSSDHAHRKLFTRIIVDQIDQSPTLPSNVLLSLIEALGDDIAGVPKSGF
ncbi:MAG: hypothetical protein M1823_002825 [Watsoniomyces obsoletus]|nr:MAG: hypothetical protein M1823_002825 [Watsoniomyces obsoletus]